MMQPPRDIIHYHLMKTAGTTVNHLLEQMYDGHCARVPSVNAQGVSINSRSERHFLDMIVRETPIYVSGHPHEQPQLWELIADRPGKAFTFTFLRDPVERFFSLVYFWINSKYIRKHVADDVTTLEKALKHDGPPLAPNSMTRSLAAMGRSIDWREPTTNEHLALAMKHLGSFDMVGITEQFPLSYALLACNLQFTPLPIARWNVNTSYPKIEEHEDSIIQTVVKKNMLDMKLYIFAQKLFMSQVLEHEEAVEAIAETIREAEYQVNTRLAT